MPDDKFAPSPSNIVIRTMEKDIEALKAGGGELVQPPIPENIAPPQPTEDAFLYQQMPTAMPMQESAIPPPPPIETAHAAPSTGASPAPESGGKKILLKPILFALGGILGIVALGALGYFVVFPIVKNTFFAAAPSPEPSPIAEPSPDVDLLPSPSPTPTPPVITLAKSADGTSDMVLPGSSVSDFANTLILHAASENAAGTFNVLLPQYETYLDAETVFQLLFRNAPPAISSALDEKYSVFLYWVKPTEPHLGALFSLKPQAVEAVKTAMREWEPTLATDASMFFMGKNPGTTTIPFRDGTYQTYPLRFSVFASGLAIDHAVIANTLIFTTNRDAVFEAIRRLTGVE